ncbi:hypothetical protein BD410DRAFT_784593 [Rickenella mellea]|uniref:Uncharacterized protein n=1 Tax=Rickenella mellea TaxID=50990 RepID=A0A4Y7QD96_9AGAM|nr:hypothetical protein BD410DRAFT_784593 [Rickenella mellea]
MYAWFHVTFAIAAMYVAILLTNWRIDMHPRSIFLNPCDNRNVVSTTPPTDGSGNDGISIKRSEVSG